MEFICVKLSCCALLEHLSDPPSGKLHLGLGSQICLAELEQEFGFQGPSP